MSAELCSTDDLEDGDVDCFNCFEDNEKEDDMDDEEDAAILDLTLIKNILGNSTNVVMSDTDAPKKGQESRKVTFRDVVSVGSSHDDEEKTHEELVKKIGDVQARLTQVSIDLSAERAMRRKKDKSLVKLAKELNKRASDQTEKEKKINLLKGMVADLDAKLAATRTEMDERILSNERKTKEYNCQLDEAHQKYRSFVAEHDAMVSELTKSHNAEAESLRRAVKDSEMEIEQLRVQIALVGRQAEAKVAEAEKTLEALKLQYEESRQKARDAIVEYESKAAEMNCKHECQVNDLRHQLLAAKLECDMIRTELASLQMQASPGDAANIVDRTMKSASPRAAASPPMKHFWALSWKSWCTGAVIIAVIAAFSHTLGLISLDALCAPVLPGSVLGSADIYAEAPWWANDNMKAYTFAICGSRPRTSLKWSGGRLIISDADSAKVLLDKRPINAAIHGSVITLYSRNSKIETLRSPWAT